MRSDRSIGRGKAVGLTLAISACLALAATGRAAPPESAAALAGEETVVKVNGETISVEDFRNFFKVYIAQNYYHGVDPAQRAAIADEAMDLLINDRLLLHEAHKRGLKGDPAKAEARLQELKKRFGSSPETASEFDKRSAAIKAEILDDTRIEELKKSVKDAGVLSIDRVRAFYDQNHKLFTTPQSTDISMILIGVPPGGVSDEWHAAAEKAAGLLSRIRAGESFEAIAKENSTDPSADQGGNLGLLHEGQVPEEVAKVLDKTDIGGITDPIRILEGVAIFRVNGREPPTLHSFDGVRERAEALLRRQIEDEKWRDFLAGLRAGALIEQLISPADVVRDI